MKNQSFIYRFLVRWLVCSLGLWISAAFLGSHITYNGSLGVIIWAGFFLAIINAILKPILVIFSLPAILLTLGLFMVIINGFTVYLVSHIYTSLQVTSFLVGSTCWYDHWLGKLLSNSNFGEPGIMNIFNYITIVI